MRVPDELGPSTSVRQLLEEELLSGESQNDVSEDISLTQEYGTEFHEKAAPNACGLIVTPGASTDREHATPVAIKDGLPEITVERLRLGTTSVKIAVAKIRTAAEKLAERINCKPKDIAFGGRSLGEQACSVAVAEGLPAAALVLLSYPLHPSGRSENFALNIFRIKAPALSTVKKARSEGPTNSQSFATSPSSDPICHLPKVPVL